MKKPIKNNGFAKPPKALSPAAKRLWRDLMAEYALSDVAAKAILTAGLEAFDRMSAAKTLLDADGPVIEDRWKQKKMHPAACIEKDSRAAWMAALKALNLDIEPLRDGPGRPGKGGA